MSNLDAGLFGRSLDKMLEQLRHLADGDIGNEIEGVDGHPVGEVKITKVVGKPLEAAVGDEDDDFDPSIPEHDGSPENDFDDHGDDELRNALDDIGSMTGEHADPEWLKSTGRDPHDFIKQFAHSEPDEDDEASFPQERLAKLLGNRKI